MDKLNLELYCQPIKVEGNTCEFVFLNPRILVPTKMSFISKARNLMPTKIYDLREQENIKTVESFFKLCRRHLII